MNEHREAKIQTKTSEISKTKKSRGPSKVAAIPRITTASGQRKGSKTTLKQKQAGISDFK